MILLAGLIRINYFICMRIDKWLKMARIFKSREEAARACDLGRVKLNGLEAKPSKIVKVGDAIVVKVERLYRTLTIKDIPTRGLSARDAKLIYDERTPDLPPDIVELMKYQAAEDRRRQREMKGRPTKKDRRQLDKWRGRG
ncbi:MAG: RNA-binding S4 domain-containing protein [candidate division KSB1 bacterium]|nr:RNA-binding S4 domain-containing protein [candidate division KSB1 bacterium]MDZ7304518.1 RNA-binding S4 domain-containing protein [candidate division KSB1 bacterium]MDZ7313898.1 RNA-binding S4 domain-containing protein [candidate division KSB1 bacterium]